MKRNVFAGISLALGLSLCAGGVAHAAEAQHLVIYSAEEMVQDFAKLYMEQHPDIDVQVLLGSSGETNARIAAEKDSPQGDVAVSGTDPSAANPELYLKAREALDLSAVDPRFLFGDYAATIVTYPVIFAYNAQQLGEDQPPATWAELADPKWKGRLYMGNPATSEAAYKAMTTMWSIGGWELVEKIAANAVITEGSIDPLRALGNSEAAIGIGVENQVYKWADGTTVKAVYPSDGVIMHLGTWYLVKNSPNPKEAVDFVQWMLSPATQAHMAKTYKGARPSIVGADEPTDVPKVSELKIIPFPDEARTNRASFNERWKDIITSVQ